VSYFRPQNVRKIAPRSVSSLPNSTQNVSRKRGWVTAACVPIPNCLNRGVHPRRLCHNCATKSVLAVKTDVFGSLCLLIQLNLLKTPMRPKIQSFSIIAQNWPNNPVPIFRNQFRFESRVGGGDGARTTR
jgi:hypothetical protein